MKSLHSAVASRWLRALALSLSFSSAISRAAVVDPSLHLTITAMDQSVVLSWSGPNAVPYQLQSSSNLTSWSDDGPVLTGNGASLLVTNSIIGQDQGFYRVKRLFPAPENSAVFDPTTGLLTIVGDDSDNTIVVGPNGGNIFVTIGGVLVPITGGVPTTTNTVLIQVLGMAGNDQISINPGLPPAHLFGGIGNDTLTGGSAADMLAGGPDADTLNGQGSSDFLFGEDGDDAFVWNPGGGNDLVEGGNGHDTLLFNGANIGENIDLSANGTRLRFLRNIASVSLDVDGVEQANFNAVGGADNVTVNNLTGTAVTQVNVDLASMIGATNGDSQVDSVILNGTPDPDTINFSADAGAVVATGMGAEVRVIHGELSFDRLMVNGIGGDFANVNGSDAADTMSIGASGTNAMVSANGFTALVYVSGALTLSVNGLGGPDTISATGDLATTGVQFRFDGGESNDTILGGNGNDVLIGGPGQDFIDGNIGSDTVLLGDDDDTFQWDPGDGSDTVEGGDGQDTLVFNGSNVGENIELSANGTRLHLTRDIGTVTTDADGIERVDFNARGGADNVVVNSLADTAVTQVNIDLANIPGAGTGDSQTDTVTMSGTDGPDTIDLAADAGAIVATGLSASVHVIAAEPGFDRFIVNGVGNDLVNVNGSAAADNMSITPNGTYARVLATGFPTPIDVTGALMLAVNGLEGTDTITADSGDLAALNIPLRMDGGEAEDNIYGSNGDDELVGGPDSDVIHGNAGDDTIVLGDGDDFLFWDPGDGSDVIEGGTGADTLVFNGSANAEDFSFSAVGSRLHLVRDAGNVTLDMDGVERVDCNALGGADNVTVNSLSGTAVTQVNIDLAGTSGGSTGDSLPDVITVNGTAAADTINVAAISSTVAVSGLSALVFIAHSEAANDSLIVNGLDGVDTITAGPGVAALIALTINQ